jgi:hypothetical protein
MTTEKQASDRRTTPPLAKMFINADDALRQW